MNFEVFSKSDLEDMYHSMETNMSEEQKAVFIEHYGSMEAWKKRFLESAGREEVQKNFKKVVEWYGSKEKALDAARNQSIPETFPTYQKQLGAIIKKLSERKGADVNSPEVRELAEEYASVTRQMYRLPDASGMILELAAAYRTNTDIQTAQDRVYGEGSTEFIGRALEASLQK